MKSRNFSNVLRAIFLFSLILLLFDNFFVNAQVDGEWTLPSNLFETAGRASEAEIVADSSGVAHAFWAYAAPGNEELGSNQSIYYARLENDVWSDPIDILVSPDGQVARMQNVVVDSEGYLHIVWSGGSALYYSYAYALEAGSAVGWSQPFALTFGVSALEPAIAIGSEKELFVLWTQAHAGLMFVSSTDGGKSWSPPRAIFAASQENELARWGRIAVDGLGRLHVALTYTVNDPAAVYGRTDANLLYYLRSNDNGGSWSEPFLVVPEPDFGEVNVATFGEDVVHLVWNGRSDRTGRYHRWSEDGGQTWSDIIEAIAPAPANPLGDGGLTGFPALAIDVTGVLHMITTTYNGNYYLSWQDSNWSTPILISAGIVDGGGVTGQNESLEQPSITINNGNQLYVVFHDGFERIWHTESIIDAPYQSPIPLPPLVLVVPIETATPVSMETTPVVIPLPESLKLLTSFPKRSTSSSFLVIVLPTITLIGVVIFFNIGRSKW